MEATILFGLAKRVALMAREILRVPQGQDGLSVRGDNGDVLVEIIPESRLRKKPLLVRVNDKRIRIENVLNNVQELRNMDMVLSKLRFNSDKKIKVNVITENDLSIEIEYTKGIPLTHLDTMIKSIFKKIREIWLEIITNDIDYAVNNFGMLAIDFLGENFILVKEDFDKILSEADKYWLPRKTITLPNKDGAFINGDVGIDYIHLPILSTIINDNDELDYMIYYFKDNNELGSIKLSEVRKLYEIAKNMLIKAASKEVKESLFNIESPMKLVSDPLIWKKIVIALKELILEGSSSENKKMRRIRPSFLNDPLEDSYDSRVSLSESDRNKIIQLIPTLEKLRGVIESIYNENKLFIEMVLGRLLAALAKKYSNPFILYGDSLREEVRSVRRTKSSASITLNLKKLGIKNPPEKVKVKVIRNNEKNFIVVEI